MFIKILHQTYRYVSKGKIQIIILESSVYETYLESYWYNKYSWNLSGIKDAVLQIFDRFPFIYVHHVCMYVSARVFMTKRSKIITGEGAIWTAVSLGRLLFNVSSPRAERLFSKFNSMGQMLDFSLQPITEQGMLYQFSIICDQ